MKYSLRATSCRYPGLTRAPVRSGTAFEVHVVTGALLATEQDGTPLPRPRLVVPGDRKGGRYVSDLVELKVVRVAR